MYFCRLQYCLPQIYSALCYLNGKLKLLHTNNSELPFFVGRKRGLVNARLGWSRVGRPCVLYRIISALQSTQLRKGRDSLNYHWTPPVSGGDVGECTHILCPRWSDFSLDQTYNGKTVSTLFTNQHLGFVHVQTHATASCTMTKDVNQMTQ
jgi:hypothetical protein